MAVTEAPGERREAPSGELLRTVPGVFRDRASRYGDREYLHYHDGNEWQVIRWRDAAERVTRIAAALLQRGVQPHDAVAIIAPNRYEWILCDWAIQSIGAMTVPIYPTYTSRIVNYILHDSGAVLAIAGDASLAAKIEAAPPLKGVVEIGSEVATWMATEVSPVERAAVDERLGALTPDGIATIIYTSGTTGDPKGVVLLHRNFVDTAEATLQIFPVTDVDIEVSWMPYSHSFERMCGVFMATHAGATLWLSRGTDHLVEDITYVRPTLMLGVPRIWEKMHDAVYSKVRHGPAIQRALFNWGLDVGRRRLAGEHGAILSLEERIADRLVLKPLRVRLFGDRIRCFLSGGAPLNEKVEEFFWVLGTKLMQGWGLTETTTPTTASTETVHKYRTVGKAIPGTEIKIAEDGEILVKGTGVMPGYWNRPDATAEVMTEDGWFKTGDLGFLDSEGFLTITDRKKDLIKTSGGKFIAPLPIEARLESDPYVATAMLIGDGHPYVVALIVPDFAALAADEGISGEPQTLVHDARLLALFQARVDEVNRDLASFESVKYFALVPREFSELEGELTPTLKTKRRVVAEHFKDVVDEMYSRVAPEA